MSLLIGIIICVILLAVLGPLIRFVIIGIVLWAIILGMSEDSNSTTHTTAPNTTTYSSVTTVLTYEQLVDYTSDCSKKEEQLKELTEIQRIKNFDPDPDKLNPWDRAYNSRLKASIWWYAYRCEQ